MSVITVSRELGSGGGEIAKGVAQKLSYNYVDREIILEAAKSYSVPEKKLEEVFTKRPRFIERFVEDQKIYLIFIEDIILKFALKDNIVIVGSGGHISLKNISHVLKVRLTAPLPKRVETIMKSKEWDKKKAEEMVMKNDKDRMSRMHYLYDIDWRAPTQYDIVINTESLTQECAIDMIINTIKREDFTPSDKSRRALEDKALTCNIKARLATHPLIIMSNIDIMTEERTVTITGSVFSGNEKSLVIETVKEIVGDNYIDNLSIVHPPQGDLF